MNNNGFSCTIHDFEVCMNPSFIFLLLAVALTMRSIMSMVDADNVSVAISQPDNTIRVDPLDHFQKYRGGFNITNKHYWSVYLYPFSFLNVIF